MTEQEKEALRRVKISNVILEDADTYLKTPDILPKETIEIPGGYKKCGGCKKIQKFYLFNINNSVLNKCTGNCKECQKKAAVASYERNKKKRDYKKYYQENKERKQEHGRKYYAENKEKILATQKKYHVSSAGKKVMQKAHFKRRKAIANNKGILYKREWVIDRDKNEQDKPVCYLCGEVIEFERDIQLDHVIPIVLGGSDCFTNIACSHGLCNLRREKDARRLTTAQVNEIIGRAEAYIDSHPELFESR
jgi:5-methylcytosine-specific restriction endonuclease McrA